MTEKDLSKVLFTGAGGMVGSYLDFGIKTTHETLNIESPTSIKEAMEKYMPSVVVHLAAETNTGLCESDPQHAYAVNAIGTYYVASEAKKIGARMIYISTNAVFDGKKGAPYNEEDATNPESVYGRSKYAGELFVRDIVPHALIIRTSWIFGGGAKNDKKFVGKIVAELAKPDMKELTVASDVFASPTYAKDLASAIRAAILKNEEGVLHVANSGVASRFEMAHELVTMLRPDISLIPVSFRSIPGKTVPEGNTGFAASKYHGRPWQDALKEYIASEWKK